MGEFATYGYEQASTNRMVEQAGIGKGMLFYYFGSKRKLFDYVIDYAINVVDQEYVRHFDDSEPDFISRYMEAVQAKFEAYTRYTQVFILLGSQYLRKDRSISDQDLVRLKDMEEAGMAVLFSNVDTSLFRDDLDQEDVFKIIRWTIDGYQNELMGKLQNQDLAELDWNVYMEGFNQFLDVLRRILYK